MYVINQSTTNDRLVSASSPVAASVDGRRTDRPARRPLMIVGGSAAGTGGQTEPGASEPAAEPPLDATLVPPAAGESAPSTLTPGSEPNEPADTSPTGALAPVPGEAPAAGLQPAPGLQQIEPSTRFAQVELTGLREDIQVRAVVRDRAERSSGPARSRSCSRSRYPATPREAAAEE